MIIPFSFPESHAYTSGISDSLVITTEDSSNIELYWIKAQLGSQDAQSQTDLLKKNYTGICRGNRRTTNTEMILASWILAKFATDQFTRAVTGKLGC